MTINYSNILILIDYTHNEIYEMCLTFNLKIHETRRECILIKCYTLHNVEKNLIILIGVIFDL